jgi:hypothetical protein
MDYGNGMAAMETMTVFRRKQPGCAQRPQRTDLTWLSHWKGRAVGTCDPTRPIRYRWLDIIGPTASLTKAWRR